MAITRSASNGRSMNSRVGGSGRRVLVMAGVLLLLGAMAGSASAQDIIAPPISDADLNEYVAILTLSDAQFKAIEPKYQDYLTRWRAWEEEHVKPIDEQRSRLTPIARQRELGGPEGDFNRLNRSQQSDLINTLRDKAGAFDQQFFDQIVPFLTDEQIEELQIVRDLRQRGRLTARVKEVPYHNFRARDPNVGIATDLRRLLRGVEITASERDAIAPLLEEYEHKLYQRLKEFDATIHHVRWGPISRDRFPEDLWDDVVKAGTKAWRLHRKYMEMMLPHLSPVRAEKLRDEVLGRVYHRVEPDQRRAHRYFERIKWDELNEEQVKALRTLQKDFELQHADYSQRIWRLFDDSVEDRIFWTMQEEHQHVKPMRRLIDQRDALNVDTRNALREILGDEPVQQIAVDIGWLPDGISIPTMLSTRPSRSMKAISTRFGDQTIRIQTTPAGLNPRLGFFDPYALSPQWKPYFDQYMDFVGCDARQRAVADAAWEQLNKDIEGVSVRAKWLKESASELWTIDREGNPNPPTRARLRAYHRENEAISDSIVAADERFLAAIDAVLEPAQQSAMQIFRELHWQWRHFKYEPIVQVGPVPVREPVREQLADIRDLMIKAGVSVDGWTRAAPALDTYRTKSRALIKQQRDAAWKIHKLSQFIAIDNLAAEDGNLEIDYAPNTPDGNALRQAIADYLQAHYEHVELHDETRQRLRQLLPDGDFLQFQSLYVTSLAQAGMIGDSTGRVKLAEALKLDDLSAEQRTALIELHMELIEADDALSRKAAQARLTARDETRQYWFERDGTFARTEGSFPPSSAAEKTYRDIEQQKRELWATMLRRLRHILNDAQEQAIGIAD